MEPVVNRLKKDYRNCITLERVNFHAQTARSEQIGPLGSPEFALLDSSDKILYRWFGVVERSEFDEVMMPLCTQ
jgi:hypothetical protein